MSAQPAEPWPWMATATDTPTDVLRAELLDVIGQAQASAPRSQQRVIGPSGLGNPCDRCLARALAQVPEPGPTSWKTTVGTAVHAWLAEAFDAANAEAGQRAAAALEALGQPPAAAFLSPGLGRDEVRWLTETRVSVGDVDGLEVKGTADLYDRLTATVIDWKTSTPKRLAGFRAIADPMTSPEAATYVRQVMLYGRGFIRLGLPVASVALVFLPRDGELEAGHVIHLPYREQVALDTLERATRMSQALRTVGPDVLIPLLPTEHGCWGCRRHAIASSRGLAGLLPGG